LDQFDECAQAPGGAFRGDGDSPGR
jgi:hypothetical protein